jgi:hypothetical protein
MFIEDLVDYIETNTSLVIDTDLFIGADQPDTSAKCVFVMEFAGGGENWSGQITRPVQVLSKDLTYLTAEALANVVYDLLSNKAGFLTLSDVFFCEVLNRPFPVGRDQRGSYIFSSNFLFRMK